MLSALLGITLILTDIEPGTKTNEGDTEEKIRAMCEQVSGVGRVSVAVTLEGEKICGVGIVCEGGDDPNVVKRLLSLISASCAVPTSKIYITYCEKDSPAQS